MKAKPTPAQVRYLREATDLHVYGAAFYLYSPGGENTGSACLRRGWITQVGVHPSGVVRLYKITPLGRAVLEAAEAAEKERS